MSSSSSLVPPQGNPLRPIFILLAVFFAATLVGFPILMHASGLGIGSTLGVTLLTVVVALICLGFTLWMAGSVEQDRVGLQTTDAWATWQISEEEYRAFTRSERRRVTGWALTYAIGGLVMGIFFLTKAEDRLTGLILIVVFLIVAGIMVALGGPPWRASVNSREVRVGQRGVQALGRYLPLEATATHLTFVELRPEDPAVLVFFVRTGNRTQEARVPVAHGHWEEAERLVERFRQDAGRT